MNNFLSIIFYQFFDCISTVCCCVVHTALQKLIFMTTYSFFGSLNTLFAGSGQVDSVVFRLYAIGLLVVP